METGILMAYLAFILLTFVMQVILCRWIFRIDERVKQQNDIITLLNKISRDLQQSKKNESTEHLKYTEHR